MNNNINALEEELLKQKNYLLSTHANSKDYKEGMDDAINLIIEIMLKLNK